MRLAIDANLDYTLAEPSDLLFALEVAQLPDQILIDDLLTITGVEALTPIDADESLGRRTWTRGQGRIHARYVATLDVLRPKVVLAGLRADEKRTLPALVVPYLWPSRYCEADQFETFVGRTFGHLRGGDQVHAIAAWIRSHVDYAFGTSDESTSAVDSFVRRAGVCRDFAHLMIAMTRAAGIPARIVAAYAYLLDPQDFHAVVEVWLEGAWHIVDATGLAPCDGIVRIGVGRDATDVSFLTVFGTATLNAQSVNVRRID